MFAQHRYGHACAVGSGQWDRNFRPFARLLASTLRPSLSFNLFLKPNFLFLFTLDGWYSRPYVIVRNCTPPPTDPPATPPPNNPLASLGEAPLVTECPKWKRRGGGETHQTSVYFARIDLVPAAAARYIPDLLACERAICCSVYSSAKGYACSKKLSNSCARGGKTANANAQRVAPWLTCKTRRRCVRVKAHPCKEIARECCICSVCCNCRNGKGRGGGKRDG